MAILTPAQQEQFSDDGFIILDEFYSDEEMSDFSSEVKQIIHAYLHKAAADTDGAVAPQAFTDENILDDGLLALEEVDHEYVAAVYDTIAYCTAFLRLVGKKETQAVVNQLLDNQPDTPLYGFTNRCRIDPPRDERRTYGWHQEVFYTIPKSRFLQTWAPLIRDTTYENGTIEVCVGSHQAGVSKQDWTEKEGCATQIIVDEEVVNQYEQKVVEMTVGQILVFTGKTVHRSGSNTSDQVRYSLVGMYHDIQWNDFLAPKPDFTFRRIQAQQYYQSVASAWQEGAIAGD